MITGDDVRAHLPHRVKDAPHLCVCACGEVSRAIPGEATATEVWADHLARALNVAQRAAEGAL